MKIPDSIESLTTSKPADPFNIVPKLADIPLDDIVLAFKRTLPPNTLKDFETGLAYFKKDTTSEKNVIKNFICLISDYIVQSIQTSEIDVDTRDIIIVQTKKILESLSDNFDSLYNILIIFNKQKNLLDVNGIIMIIIGYAISLIKKTYRG